MFTACFTGNLGAEPTFDMTSTGTERARFRLAVNVGKDKPAVWYNCTAFGTTARLFADSVPLKGQRIVVRATKPITARTYKDRDGVLQVALDCDVDWLESVNPKEIG